MIYNKRLKSIKQLLKVIVIFLLTILLSACFGKKTPASVSRAKGNQYRVQKIYTVKKGDNLNEIARRLGTNPKDLAKNNKIKLSGNIYPGQKLKYQEYQRRPRNNYSTTNNRRNIARNNRSSIKTYRKENNSYNRRDTLNKHTATTNIVSNLKWNWPASGNIVDEFNKSSSSLQGIQILSKKGTPIKAAANGTVVYSGNALRGYGNLIIIKHDDVFLSAYAHNDKILVKEGDKVKIGQHIANMGNSGSKDVKLHFEIRKNGTPINPLRLLPHKS